MYAASEGILTEIYHLEMFLIKKNRLLTKIYDIANAFVLHVRLTGSKDPSV